MVAYGFKANIEWHSRNLSVLKHFWLGSGVTAVTKQRVDCDTL